MSNSNQPAYPLDVMCYGLTKRELFALEFTKAWTVVLGQRECSESDHSRGDEAIRLGRLQADALLAALEEAT